MARPRNVVALRVPKAVAQDAQLQQGDSVTIAVAGRGDLMIKAQRRKRKLDDLVSRITHDNRHGEVDWGSAPC